MTLGIAEQAGKSYKLKKNITKVLKSPHFSYTVNTNSFGFRDKNVGIREIGQKPYFLFLGESLTFGNGLDYEQTFVGLFAQLLEKDGLDVLNLAVGGHRFLEQKELLYQFINSVPKKPSKIIICFSPLFIEGFDKPYSEIVIKKGYAFENGNWFFPLIRTGLGNFSAAYCFFRDNIGKLQASLFNYNKKYALDLFRFYSNNNRLATPAVANELEHSLDSLDEYIHQIGAIPIYIYIPLSTDFMLDNLLTKANENPADYNSRFYYKLLENHCRNGNIYLISVFSALKEHYEKGETLNFIRDPHYNALANRIIYETIIQGLKEKGDIF